MCYPKRTMVYAICNLRHLMSDTRHRILFTMSYVIPMILYYTISWVLRLRRRMSTLYVQTFHIVGVLYCRSKPTLSYQVYIYIIRWCRPDLRYSRLARIQMIDVVLITYEFLSLLRNHLVYLGITYMSQESLMIFVGFTQYAQDCLSFILFTAETVML